MTGVGTDAAAPSGVRSALERTALPALILVLVAVLYLPVLDYPFLSLDDQYGVATNPGIRDLSWRGLRFLFFEDRRDWRYFPVSYLSFAVDYALFGLAPGAVHGTNLLIHLANAALVFALVRTLTRDSFAAAVTSLLFGIHPLQVESVAWVSSRKTELFFFFYLLSIFAYLGWARAAPPRRGRALALLAASVLLFLLSMTAKATAVTLPAVLLLVDAAIAPELPRNPFAFVWRHLPSKLLYLPPIAFTAMMTARLARNSPFGGDVAFGAVEWISIAGHNLFFYVAKALVPIHLGVFYPLPNDGVPGLPLHYYAFALLGVSLVGLCIWSYGRCRWVFFGLAWYLVTVLPNAMQPVLFQDPPLVAADRYFYQSAVGLFLVLGVALSAAWQRFAAASRPRRTAFAFLAALVVAGELWLAHQQVRAFRETIPLYEQTLLHHPSDAFYYRLAIEYANAGRLAAASDALERADRAPNRIFFENLFGFQMKLSDLYRRNGDFPKAAAFLARAIDATPNALEPSSRTPLAYRYLALLYDQAGDPARAAAARTAAEAARYEPSHYFEGNWIAMAPDAALPFLERRVREAPRDSVAWFYLGRGLQLQGGQSERAAECLRRAEELGPPRRD